MIGMHVLALIFCISGTGAVIGAITSNEWKVTSRATSVITATWVFQGLWMNCAGNALGSYHCRPHLTLFRLEGFMQACRALMISAICLGFFGTIFGFIGMKCTRIGGSDQTKAKIACLAGLLFIFSGICSLTGCSLYAHKTTSEYFDPSVPQKYEFGTALFVGWAGAALCLVGGCIFCATLVAERNQQPRTDYSYAAASVITSRTRPSTAANRISTPRSSNEFNKTAYV
ncbi:claudin-10 [Spea bombifrons]|uniref:claudin-10 n=1 Tax=Spea bombifrons TaxID=233779 RepID=UPI002349D569|nr:claudin-10 [Spea bombifrons]